MWGLPFFIDLFATFPRIVDYQLDKYVLHPERLINKLNYHEPNKRICKLRRSSVVKLL